MIGEIVRLVEDKCCLRVRVCDSGLSRGRCCASPCTSSRPLIRLRLIPTASHSLIAATSAASPTVQETLKTIGYIRGQAAGGLRTTANSQQRQLKEQRGEVESLLRRAMKVYYK